MKLTALFLRAHGHARLSEADKAALEDAVARTARFADRAVIVREGVPLGECTLLIEGIAFRYKDSDDGKRQILAIHFPGDFVDLHSYPLKRLEHSVGALTPVKMAIMPHAAVRALTERSAVITELLWRSTLIDAAMNREWLVSVGTRPAIGRVAHLFCELFVRLRIIDLVRGSTFDLPMTQSEIGEATGLTPVHTNRMLRQLRERGLLSFRNALVTILDWDKLRDVAGFDPDYLFLE